MTFSPALRRPLATALILLLFVSASRIRAEEKAGSGMSQVRDEILRMTDFFGNQLPGTLKRYNMTLEFTPKFSDVRSQEFVRFPLLLRYGISDRWEIFGGMTPFIPNPFNNGRQHRWGPGESDFGVRYDLARQPIFYDDVTFGLETRIPLGRPPFDLNDGYTHVRPFVTGARKLSWRHTTFYTNYSYDRELNTPGRDAPFGVGKRSVLDVAPALLYKPGEFGGFVDYSFRFFDQPGNNHFGHEYQLGVIWDVRLQRTQSWHLPGKWQVEFAYKITTEQGLPDDRGFSLHVRWRTNLRQVLHWDTGQKPDKK